MFIEKALIMRFTSYTKTDSFYIFNIEGGGKLYAPLSSVVLIDDNSGAVTVKYVASRKIIGYVI